MEKIILESGQYYHVFNRGNNGQNIFFEEENYTFFLHRYLQYITPFCKTLAWVLLENHFHFLIYIKPYAEISFDQLEYTATEVPKKIDVHLQFGHFFNSYAKAINKRYNRTGSLFEKNFDRKLVTGEECLKELILYIHFNPVKHFMSKDLRKYFWSSYQSIISQSPTKLDRSLVLDLYKSREQFVLYHQHDPDERIIRDSIIE